MVRTLFTGARTTNWQSRGDSHWAGTLTRFHPACCPVTVTFSPLSWDTPTAQNEFDRALATHYNERAFLTDESIHALPKTEPMYMWRLPQGRESAKLVSVDRLGWAVEQGCVGTGSAAFFVFCDPAVELVALL